MKTATRIIYFEEYKNQIHRLGKLELYDEDKLVRLFKLEVPMVWANLLLLISREKSARILKKLDKEKRTEILLCISKLKEPSEIKLILDFLGL